MRQLVLGDIIRNTNRNWHGTRRRVIGVRPIAGESDALVYTFTILDGPHIGDMSVVTTSTMKRLFIRGDCAHDYPMYLAIPQGAWHGYTWTE